MHKSPSVRQLLVLAGVALLAPLTSLVSALAKQGGSLGWVVPLVAIPILLLWGWVIFPLTGLGLANGLTAVWGRAFGGGLRYLYYIWCVFLAVLHGRTCITRLLRADYQSAPPWLLAGAVFLVAAWLYYKGREAFLRATALFYLALLGGVICVVVLGAMHLKWENVQVDWRDAAGIGPALVPALGTFALGILPAFLGDGVVPGEKDGRRVAGWTVGIALVTAAIALVVVGTLGPRLAGELATPFFLVLQGLGVEGAFQRVEALGTALWVLSDLALLGLLALAGQRLAGKEKKGGLWGCVVLVGGFFGGWLLPDAQLLVWGQWGVWVNLMLGMAVPTVLALTHRAQSAK